MKDLPAEDQVVSLLIAQRLKEHGFPQDCTLWHWVGNQLWYYQRVIDLVIEHNKRYAAPNASEMIRQLPKYHEKLGRLVVYWDQGRLLWIAGYEDFTGLIDDYGKSVKLENALALCWINIQEVIKSG